MEKEKLIEYAALAESASSHPISKSLQRAYGKQIDRSRVKDIQEISGNGVIAKVDGVEVAAGIANMWLAIFADVGVMILAVLNAIRALFVKKLQL